MEIRLHTGPAAAQRLADPDFIRAWGELAHEDPKQTALQEPPFVTTWYTAYQQRYRPLLCLAYDDAGQLAGVMPLALGPDGEVVHAGAHQAEYHGWICQPSIEGRFPAACLLQLQRELDLGTWAWRWLPPGAPVAWLNSPELAERGIAARIQEEQDSPLWDLQDERRLKKLLKNKSLKIKRNRYRKGSGLRLERITDRQQAQAVFPALVDQCDFRQGAIHGVRPFADDDRKLAFYLERLASPSANHFTVLWTGDQPVASNFGACSADTMLVGLSTFDPAQSRNSPGMLLLLALAQLCQEEGIRYIDLTPGGDAYKDKFANARRRLVMPTFHFTRPGRVAADLRRSLRRQIKAALLAAVGEPQLARARDRVGQLRTALSGAGRGRAQALYQRRELQVYRVDAPLQIDANDANDDALAPPLRVQRYQELLQQTAALSPGGYQPLLSEALRRFSAGDVLYTATQDGRLVFSGWRSAPRKRHALWTGGPELETEQKSALIYDLRGEGASAEQRQRWLSQLIVDAAGAALILVSVSVGDDASRATLQGRATLHERFQVTSILGV